MAFHAHDGWYFERTDDGTVAVTHPGGEVTFDKGTWASIVASVSADGETASTFGKAETLHGNPKGLIRASVTMSHDPSEPMPDPQDWR